MEKATIELDLTDEEFIFLAKEAHMQDITFNEYIEQILMEYMKTLNTQENKLD